MMCSYLIQALLFIIKSLTFTLIDAIKYLRPPHQIWVLPDEGLPTETLLTFYKFINKRWDFTLVTRQQVCFSGLLIVSHAVNFSFPQLELFLDKGTSVFSVVIRHQAELVIRYSLCRSVMLAPSPPFHVFWSRLSFWLLSSLCRSSIRRSLIVKRGNPATPTWKHCRRWSTPWRSTRTRVM